MNHLLKTYIGIILLFTGFLPAISQEKEIIVFYNVENFFDTEDNPLCNDEEFTVQGTKKWDTYRYNKKHQDIFKIFAAIGEWSSPALICLAEIENRKVAEDLISQTPLAGMDYEVAHYDSPDQRCMDVAFLYRKSAFCCDTFYVLPVFLNERQEFSRDILFIEGKLHGVPLCIAINHWPSRRGGIAASEKFRMKASEILFRQVNMLFLSKPELNLIVAGDFNDEPHNKSLKMLTRKITATNLLVVPCDFSGKVRGTLKYRGKWFSFDHFLVSENMMKENLALSVHQKKANIFDADYLLTEEKKEMGYKPYRTYLGNYYAGGVSDHLPVYLILDIN